MVRRFLPLACACDNNRVERRIFSFMPPEVSQEAGVSLG